MAISTEHRSYTDLEEELESEHSFRRTVGDLCGLLLVIIDEKIYLLHQTAKEFLVRDELVALPSTEPSLSNTWKHCLYSKESNKVLAERCIWYLSLANEEIHRDPFFTYRAQYWPLYFRESCMYGMDTIAAQALYLCKAKSNQYKAWSRYSPAPDCVQDDLTICRWLPRSPTHCILSSLGFEALVILLLNGGGVDMNVKDPEYGRTPLSWTAGHGHDTIVKLLLDAGKIDPGSEDYSGKTPLAWAARGGHDDVVEFLLDSGEVGPDSKVKSQVLNISAGRSSPGPMIKVDETPLLLAAKIGHGTVVKLLLDTGKVDPNLKDDLGLTSLSHAAQNGHEKVVKILLDAENVDPESQDMLGRTPLLLAAMKGKESVVNLLIISGKVYPESRDYTGRAPLSLAAAHGYERVVKQLYDTGRVDPDSRNENCRTPFSYAAGADPNAQSTIHYLGTGMSSNKIPSIAVTYERERLSALQVLLEIKVVNVDSRDIFGRIPLSYAAAAKWRGRQLIEVLLKTGKVDVDSMDEEGRTPLSYAVES
ncbi:hypothetical protein ABOM_003000 [Aspergillus bombycis]|uniref:Ankyrin repeat-containing protein n=1 Tax=Aspergillus bombycis TaxID=109264 RepID=A0A1F8AAN6_9EURO|nr:hypothetical protein ABOM_003000 [Aspergillus bombycis]OGM48777.1 hypothetical protein ABOM_003000 [Aspergillus bombycis]